MQKYLRLLKYEMKNIFKDPLSLIILFMPIIVLILFGVVAPIAIHKIENQATVGISMLILLVVIMIIGGFATGAILGFSLIECKDEKTILSICVTPIKVEGYTLFKVLYTYVLSVLSSLVVLYGLKIIATTSFTVQIQGTEVNLLDNLNNFKILVFALVNSMLGPTFALLLGSVANNKVEAFGMFKGMGIVFIIPMLTLLNFFKDAKQYLLGIVPNFWTVKAMINEALGDLSSHSSNINYYLYLLIGGIYLIFLSVVCLRFFIKKSNMN